MPWPLIFDLVSAPNTQNLDKIIKDAGGLLKIASSPNPGVAWFYGPQSSRLFISMIFRCM